MHISTLLGAVLAAGSILWQGNAQVTTECDPTKVTCPNDQGLATDSYSIDFTTIKTLPAEWQLADYTNVGLGDQGAEFTFAKRYDAPTMWTKFKFFFGRVEFVGKAAPGVGIVSSMVLLSDDLDEIDWEFLGGVTTNVQTNYFGKGYTGSYNRSTSPAVQSPQTQFHTYALDWSTAALTWSIDGVVVRTLNAADADGNGDQYPQSPMKVSLGLWDAGDPDAATQGWGGGVTPIPPPEPYTMYVKSVKIFNQNPAQQYQYTDKSGSRKSIKVINDVAFSSSSSIPATQASTLSLGSTSASSSSQASQSSEVTSSLISNSAASTAASTEPSTQLISSSSSGSSQPTVAAGSVTVENATSGYQASADSHPVITVLSTSTATLTSCSSKSDCPTYSSPGNSVTAPVASSSNVQPVSSSASGSGSTWTTPVTSAVAQITSTSASTLPSSTLPSSSNGSSSSTATSASSSASVALSTGSSSSAVVTSASLSTSVNNNSTMTTQSPYPPSSAITETDGFIQLPSVNTSSANSQYASSTATIASVSPSASSSGIASASTKPSTSGSTSSIQIVPTASTAAVTILSTESCTEESSNLGLTPPLTISSSSKTTSPSFLSFSFSSAILSSTTATSNQSGTSSSPVETSTAIPTLASSWASKAVPSGPSALFSTLVTSPSTILIPVTPILSPPSSQAPPTNIPSPSPSSPSLSQPAATSNTNSSIAVSSMTASGFSTSSAAADDTTSIAIDTATMTVACTRLPSTPAPGSDSDDEDDADDVPTSMPSTGPSASVVSQKTSSASAAVGVDNTPPVPSSASNDAPPNPNPSHNPNPESESETDTDADADADADTDDTTAPVAQDKAMAEDSSAPPASSSSDDDMEDDMDDGQEADGNPSNSPTTPTVANKTPSMSSIALAVDNGTAILKPSIASTMPDGLAIPSGTWALKNGTVPFTGSGNAVVPVSGMGLLGMVGAVMVGVF